MTIFEQPLQLICEPAYRGVLLMLCRSQMLFDLVFPAKINMQIRLNLALFRSANPLCQDSCRLPSDFLC